MFDQSVLERVNPVFNTAKMTIFQLAAAGNQDAAAIANKLGLSFEQTQNSSSTKASPEQILAGMIMMETRYRTTIAMAEQTGFSTLIDLPCGYTPRSIELARKGKRYVGLDLPAAIAEAEPAIMSLIGEDQRSLVKYAGVDATNYSSMKNALEDAEGPVCITTEGLLMYFTDSEAGALCDNIRQVLREKGGCWIIADPETALQYILTIQPICGERFMDVMKNSHQATQDKSDVKVGGSSLIVNPRGDVTANIKNAMMFLAGHGLKAERLIISDYLPELVSLSKITGEQAKAIRLNMAKCAYWKITPAEIGRAIDTEDLKAQSFDVKASLEAGRLSLRITGRVDTLTAPHLLTLFERVKTEVKSVIVDCSQLDYISSAGLRVLLIMQKNCAEGVTLMDVNHVVLEILEQTGFDSILNLLK